MNILYLAIAFAAGAGLATQAAINAQLGKALFNQPIYAALISFAVGTIFLLCLAISKGHFWQTMAQIPNQPWWRLTGGLIGAGLVFSSILLAPKLGMANMLFFLILGQLLMGMIIDHFGLIGMPIHTVTWSKIIGIGIIASGMGIFFFADKWIH